MAANRDPFKYWGDPRGTRRPGAKSTPAPYTAPTTPPPGSYDPSLDAALGSATRQYGYSTEDAATADARQRADYQLRKDRLGQQRGYSLADLLSGHTRFGEDQGTARSRFGEDQGTAKTREGQNFGMSIEGLQRHYSQLGDRQAEGAQSAGVGGGGAFAQAMAKRNANQAIDRQPLDLNHARFGEDQGTSATRFGQDQTTAASREGADYGTNVDRTNTSYDQQLGDLALNDAPSSADNPAGGRSWQDRQTTLARGGVELSNFGLDTISSQWSQAGANGYVPPPAPAATPAPSASRRAPTRTVPYNRRPWSWGGHR